MAAGDKPHMVHSGQVVWEKETTFGAGNAAGTYLPMGYRTGNLVDPGVANEWLMHRSWETGRVAAKLDRLAKNYGGPLGEFLMTDLRVPGFAWGEELLVPVDTGAGGGGTYFRHTATPTTNHPADSMVLQIHDQDADANAVRSTYRGGVMTEVEIVGGEAREVSFTPTFLWKDEDFATAKKTVTAPSTQTYKHFHGYVEVYGQQLLRVLQWRFRKVSAAERARYWNDTDPLLAYEYPLEDATFIMSARVVGDGKTFSGFSNRHMLQLAENGDIGTAQLRWAKTVDQDEAKIVIGSSNDALGIISTPRVRTAAGGKVVMDVEFACRTANYQWVDTNASRYFSS